MVSRGIGMARIFHRRLSQRDLVEEAQSWYGVHKGGQVRCKLHSVTARIFKIAAQWHRSKIRAAAQNFMIIASSISTNWVILLN